MRQFGRKAAAFLLSAAMTTAPVTAEIGSILAGSTGIVASATDLTELSAKYEEVKAFYEKYRDSDRLSSDSKQGLSNALEAAETAINNNQDIDAAYVGLVKAYGVAANLLIVSMVDIENAAVTLAADHSVASLTVNNAAVNDLSGFDITYGTDASHTGTAVPTEPGVYYAYVTPKVTNFDYKGTAKSEAFEIAIPVVNYVEANNVDAIPTTYPEVTEEHVLTWLQENAETIKNEYNLTALLNVTVVYGYDSAKATYQIGYTMNGTSLSTANYNSSQVANDLQNNGSVYFFITDTPFDAWNIVLGDDLKLNFYTDESSVTDATCGEFSVRYTGESVDKSSPVTKTDDGNWEASAHIYAKNINQPITAQLYKGDVPVGAPITKSARDYLRSLETAYTTQYTQAVAAQQAQNAAAIKKRLAMVMATELFGDASDAYFQSTGNVNDAEVTTAITQYMAMANKTDNDITTALTGYNLPDNDVKISLVLDSKTALRVYTKYDPNISGQFVRDSVGTDVTSSSGGIAPAEYHSYFELTGLTPLHLGDMYKLSLGDGNINYTPVSALTWSQRVLNSTDQQSTRNINMAKALYAYYAAANEYSTLGQS